MRLLIIILKQEALLDRVSSALIEAGLYDTSVLDGEGAEALIEAAQPLFASFKDLFGRDYLYNRTIVCPAADPEAIRDFLDICAQEAIDFANPDIGTLLSAPCAIFDGTNAKDVCGTP